jgi:hypothetical protein
MPTFGDLKKDAAGMMGSELPPDFILAALCQLDGQVSTDDRKTVICPLSQVIDGTSENEAKNGEYQAGWLKQLGERYQENKGDFNKGEVRFLVPILKMESGASNSGHYFLAEVVVQGGEPPVIAVYNPTNYPDEVSSEKKEQEAQAAAKNLKACFDKLLPGKDATVSLRAGLTQCSADTHPNTCGETILMIARQLATGQPSPAEQQQLTPDEALTMRVLAYLALAQEHVLGGAGYLSQLSKSTEDMFKSQLETMSYELYGALDEVARTVLIDHTRGPLSCSDSVVVGGYHKKRPLAIPVGARKSVPDFTPVIANASDKRFTIAWNELGTFLSALTANDVGGVEYVRIERECMEQNIETIESSLERCWPVLDLRDATIAPPLLKRLLRAIADKPLTHHVTIALSDAQITSLALLKGSTTGANLLEKLKVAASDTAYTLELHVGGQEKVLPRLPKFERKTLSLSLPRDQVEQAKQQLALLSGEIQNAAYEVVSHVGAKFILTITADIVETFTAEDIKSLCGEECCVERGFELVQQPPAKTGAQEQEAPLPPAEAGESAEKAKSESKLPPHDQSAPKPPEPEAEAQSGPIFERKQFTLVVPKDEGGRLLAQIEKNLKSSIRNPKVSATRSASPIPGQVADDRVTITAEIVQGLTIDNVNTSLEQSGLSFAWGSDIQEVESFSFADPPDVDPDSASPPSTKQSVHQAPAGATKAGFKVSLRIPDKDEGVWVAALNKVFPEVVSPGYTFAGSDADDDSELKFEVLPEGDELDIASIVQKVKAVYAEEDFKGGLQDITVTDTKNGVEVFEDIEITAQKSPPKVSDPLVGAAATPPAPEPAPPHSGPDPSAQTPAGAATPQSFVKIDVTGTSVDRSVFGGTLRAAFPGMQGDSIEISDLVPPDRGYSIKLPLQVADAKEAGEKFERLSTEFFEHIDADADIKIQMILQDGSDFSSDIALKKRTTGVTAKLKLARLTGFNSLEEAQRCKDGLPDFDLEGSYCICRSLDGTFTLGFLYESHYYNDREEDFKELSCIIAAIVKRDIDLTLKLSSLQGGDVFEEKFKAKIVSPEAASTTPKAAASSALPADGEEKDCFCFTFKDLTDAQAKIIHEYLSGQMFADLHKLGPDLSLTNPSFGITATIYLNRTEDSQKILDNISAKIADVVDEEVQITLTMNRFSADASGAPAQTDYEEKFWAKKALSQPQAGTTSTPPAQPGTPPASAYKKGVKSPGANGAAPRSASPAPSTPVSTAPVSGTASKSPPSRPAVVQRPPSIFDKISIPPAPAGGAAHAGGSFSGARYAKLSAENFDMMFVNRFQAMFLRKYPGDRAKVNTFDKIAQTAFQKRPMPFGRAENARVDLVELGWLQKSGGKYAFGAQAPSKFKTALRKELKNTPSNDWDLEPKSFGIKSLMRV